MSDWISVEDRLPKADMITKVIITDGEDIDVAVLGSRTVAYPRFGWWIPGPEELSFLVDFEPTHWRPLPKLPRTKEQEQKIANLAIKMRRAAAKARVNRIARMIRERKELRRLFGDGGRCIKAESPSIINEMRQPFRINVLPSYPNSGLKYYLDAAQEVVERELEAHQHDAATCECAWCAAIRRITGNRIEFFS